MIKSIHIKNVATFEESPEVLEGLERINFVFGSNGTGKTTISRIIANASVYPDCGVVWKGGMPLETLVYNRDFVENNFNKSNELQGIFTLGEKDKEIVDKLEAAQKELESIKESLETLKISLDGDGNNEGKIGESRRIEAEFTEECWRLKLRYDYQFQAALTGVRGSKVRFKDKLLEECNRNTADLHPLSTLVGKAETIFDEIPQEEVFLTIPNWEPLIAYESHPILEKKVIGRSDVDIAEMINKVGNSDWVRQGRKYYDPENRVCPFCQKETELSLEQSLNEYFGETYEADFAAIKKLYTDYESNSERIVINLNGLLDNSPRHLDVEKLQNFLSLLDSKTDLNVKKIEEKLDESTRLIKLDSIRTVIDSIQILFEEANTEIREHNKIVENIQSEQFKLIDEVWRFLVEEIQPEMDSYKRKRADLKKAIDSLEKKISNKVKEKSEKELEIRNLEKDTTSIQPTIDAINSILQSFGFQGFILNKSDRKRFYIIQRVDGSDAKETLSEGERSFIAFLYFYHLVKGSVSESGVGSDRVIVLDDPVSSLDSNVLFVVSSLIKEIFKDLRKNSGTIKQVFVLTHNAYFHNEVSYNNRRSGDGRKLKDETFWTVTKSGFNSEIEYHETNPIRSIYESLWIEVRQRDRYSALLQNTLRRILEHYFKILGNVDPDTICAHFNGQEKLICRSLFSWVNEGSHFAHDDPHFSPDETTVESYLTVFKNIFERTGNIAHYNMMMGNPMREIDGE